jgi:flagellar biosynthetic protein FlhB
VAESSNDKSQDATPHRRQQAREEGQVAQSPDLASAGLLIAGLVVVLIFGGKLVEFFLQLAHSQLGGEAWLSADQDFAIHQSHAILLELTQVFAPVLGLFLLAAVLVHVVQTGFVWVPQKLALDPNRISPLSGFQRLFSLSNVVRLVMGLFKVVIVSLVAFWSLYHRRDEILGVSALELSQIAKFIVDITLWTSLKIALALLILAIADYAYQRWKYEQDLRMSPQEVREEMKNLQGDPQIIARRRAIQRQMVANRISTSVPKADVVVTNPTELSVAIQYDPEEMAAPVVVAKGAGVLAQRIRRLALENNIPIVERKPLAQLLYKDVDVGKPIPADSYAAVAEVLAYVYQLKGKKLPMPQRAA